MGVCFSPHLGQHQIKSSEWLLRNHSAEFGRSLYSNISLAMKTRGREHCQPVCPAHLVCCEGWHPAGPTVQPDRCLVSCWGHSHFLHNTKLPLQLWTCGKCSLWLTLRDKQHCSQTLVPSLDKTAWSSPGKSARGFLLLVSHWEGYWCEWLLFQAGKVKPAASMSVIVFPHVHVVEGRLTVWCVSQRHYLTSPANPGRFSMLF